MTADDYDNLYDFLIRLYFKDVKFFMRVHMIWTILFWTLNTCKIFQSLDNYLVTPNTKLRGLLERKVTQYLYLSGARNYYTSYGRFCYSKLVFKSLNDKLADSGYSIANYYNQPYLWLYL